MTSETLNWVCVFALNSLVLSVVFDLLIYLHLIVNILLKSVVLVIEAGSSGKQIIS